jgi:hypothetical protein
VAAGTALVVGGATGGALGGYYFGKSNICVCDNGIEKTGEACTQDEASMCRACNPGYHLNDDETACTANICVCTNGTQKTGAACTETGAFMCEACNPKYHLNNDATACAANPHIVVELGSSKSKIWQIEQGDSDNPVKLKKEKSNKDCKNKRRKNLNMKVKNYYKFVQGLRNKVYKMYLRMNFHKYLSSFPYLKKMMSLYNISKTHLIFLNYKT